MTNSFTPGPWELSQYSDASEIEIYALTKTGHPDLDAFYLYFDNTTNENPLSLANAKLIAAAPDMYEALNDIAAWGDVQANQQLEATGSFGGFDEPGSVSIARAILAKVQP